MSLFQRFGRRRKKEKSAAPEPILNRIRARARAAVHWRNGLILLLAVGLVGLHLVLFPPIRSIESIQLEVGSITDQEVRAPFSFTAPRPSRELEAAQQDAAERVEPVYRVLDGSEHRSEQRLRDVFRQIAHYASMDSMSTAERVTQIRKLYPGLAQGRILYLLNDPQAVEVQGAVEEVVRKKLAAGIVDITPRGTYQQIRLLDATGQVESTRPVSSIVLGYRMEESVRAEVTPLLKERAAIETAVDLILEVLQPNLSYDDGETEARRVSASNLVPVVREFARNERILEAGVRITRDRFEVLGALEEARVQRALAQDATIRVRLRLGRIVLVLMLLVGLGILIRQGDRRTMSEPNRVLLLATLFAAFLALSAFVLHSPSWGGPAAVPIVLLAMLSTVLFGESVGARASIIGLLLLAIVGANASPIWVIWASAAAASVRTVRRVRHRNQFYRAIGVVSFVYIVGLTAVGMAAGDGFRETMDLVGRGVAAGIISTALCLFLLPLFEALFGITTELTLLELSDLNHPLLRRMSLESPGTYHHSQIVGTLAEQGSLAVGANSLLARVGANFHDIGKMLKPRYYAENQSDGNAHDELSPSMSALVIAAHVKDGIELGRQWGLPKEVLDYIPEHHGTSVMQYFYKKALETDEGGTVKVDDFRYPGPKPQSRETAIVMLADGIEASTRSLRRPTASRIREMVRKIIDHKLAEGELDECGLSLSDLATVREAFIPTLVGIHHQRVAYPGQKEHEDQKEKESVEARSRSRRGSPSVASGT